MEKKIKVLYISHSSNYNGAEIVLLNTLRNIDRRKFEPFVVFPSNGPLVDAINELNIQIFILPLDRWIRFRFEKPLRRSTLQSRVQIIAALIEKNSIDIVHSNTSVILEGAIAAKLMSRPHVWHIHENLECYEELVPVLPYPIVYKIIEYFSTKIITVSNSTANQFRNYINPESLVTIYNGVEQTIESSELEESEDVTQLDRQLVAVSVGLLTPNKGYIELIEAASLLKKKGLNIKIIWVGNSNKKNLKFFNSEIKRLKLLDTVYYYGYSENIHNVLSKSDFLICPSRNEAFPMVILEAMASKLPIIATDCGGITEAVIDEQTGFIVPVNDPQELSNKIMQMSMDGNKRKMFAQNGLERFKELFGLSNYINNIQSLYLEIYYNKRTPIPDTECECIKSLLAVYQGVYESKIKSIVV